MNENIKIKNTPTVISQSDKLAGESSEEAFSRKSLVQKVSNYHEAVKEKNVILKNIEKENTELCSLGMANILKSISTLATIKNDRRQVFDVVILNMLTMVRNCFDKKSSELQWLVNIKKDVDIFLRFIQFYFMEQREYIEKPAIICYLPQYKLPKQFARESTLTKSTIEHMAEKTFRKKCTNPATILDGAGYTLYLTAVGHGMYPHQQLGRLITTKCDSNITRSASRRYLLISHCPMDLHLQNILGNKLYLLESFTGKVKSVSEFGTKIFKNDHVPFFQHTHLLLGDNVNVQPLIHRKDKQTLLSMAEKNHWNKKPTAIVLSDIRKLNFIPMETLNSVKF